MKNPAIHYRITTPDPHTHLFHVELTIARPAAQQVLELPVWIPGSYLVREFAKHLQDVQAHQGQHACAVQQLDKSRWQIDCTGSKLLRINYQVHAHDNSVRTAWLDADRGFFNATSLCLMVHGQTDVPQHITIEPPHKHWQLATGLDPVKTNKQGFGLYAAPDYDTLADCPVEMGAFWSGEFDVHGVPHRFVMAQPLPGFDGGRLLADTRRICEAEMQFWHGAKPGKKQIPFDRYVFMLNAVDDNYGGLEHANSTALIASRRHLPRIGQTPGADYTTLLGLISHEYFHTWNVKRLKPAAFVPYDYARENYTELLWFFEGLTSYYDDLLLLRAGCIDLDGYLAQLQKTFDSVQGCPGRRIHSVAQASFEAWTKYYRPDANTPNATVSYYTKGALVGLCLDLTLRSEGKTTLDEVVRTLYQRCYNPQGSYAGMTEHDVRAVLQELGGRSFAKELRAWVHGTDELPVEALLREAGVDMVKKDAELSRQWGLRCKEGSSIQVQMVLRGGAAETAGFAPGDEWLGVEVDAPQAGTHNAWRVGSLAEVQACLPPATKAKATAKGKKTQAETPATLTALVARDRRLLKLPLTVPAKPEPYRKLQASAARQQAGSAERNTWPWV